MSNVDAEIIKIYLEKFKPVFYKKSINALDRENLVYFSDWIDDQTLIYGNVNTKTGDIEAKTFEVTNTYKLNMDDFYEDDDVTEQKILNAAVRPYHKHKKKDDD